ADTDFYFVANPAAVPVESVCRFRVTGRQPEWWNPETGEERPLAEWSVTNGVTVVPLRLAASGAGFVVFRHAAEPAQAVVSLTRNGQPAISLADAAKIQIQQAHYGVLGDTQRQREVTDKLQAWVETGTTHFPVARLAAGDDPAWGIVKTLTVDYTLDGHPVRLSGQDPDTLDLAPNLVFCTKTNGARGLTGTYFKQREPGGEPALVRTDAAIQFAWNRQPPATGMPAENWSARWTGAMLATKSGDYTFTLYADDGCRLFIDEQPVIDHWEPDGGNEPHAGTVKLAKNSWHQVRVEYFQAGGDDRIRLAWEVPEAPRPAEVRINAAGQSELVVHQAGQYAVTRANGQTKTAEVPTIPATAPVTGPWTVTFPPKWGAPASITMNALASLSESTNPGVKYFSGTATYTTTFDWQPATPSAGTGTEVVLDLGKVQVMAQVRLNGKDLGIWWQPPFRANVTAALQPGRNTLEIQVANLWPNRMIGDAALPADQRFTWSSYEPFTKDTPLLPSGLLGPVQLETSVVHPLGW
ncbi:MAG TPA: PA14 domain-containing protein, partial [Verrucomicrobiae bacterium]